MKKHLQKIRMPRFLTLIAAATIAVAASAITMTLGFSDDLVMDVQGTGTLKGAVQYGQSHMTFPRGNSTRVLPDVVHDREALLMYFPAESDGPIGSLTVTATHNGQTLGSVIMSPPSQMPKSDQVNITDTKVEYSTKAWSSRLPWNWQRRGVNLTLKSNAGLEQSVSSVDFGGPAELVLQHIRIGMLTPPPGATYLETDPEQAGTDYFQKIPVSKLVVGQYHPVHFTRVTLANGTVYSSASTDNGSVYSGDMREQIGKALVSVGINNANYGISSSPGTSQSQPGYYMQVVAHHSVGNYANGVQQHGLSGGNGMATLYSTSGNEFSHELGHNYGLGHYPSGFAGSVHTRTTGWGFDALRQRTIGNTNPWETEASFFGEPVGTFGGHPYGKDAMAGGFPMGSISAYTQHTGYVARVIQQALQSFGVVDSSSSTGYLKWNAQTQKMETLVDVNRRKPSSIGKPVATLIGFYDPEQKLPSTIYPPLYGGYGMAYPTETVNLDANNTQCKLVVTGANARTFTQRLASSRGNSNEMNKFHVNLEAAMLPAKVDVQCSKNASWVTLISAHIQQPAQGWPKATIVGREAGYGALANSNISVAGMVGDRVPLRSSAQLREIIAQKLGLIQSWASNDHNAKAGSVFEYANPYSGDTDYFILKNDGRYWYFPTDGSSNGTWKFIGSDKGLISPQPNPLDIRRQNAPSADDSVKQYYGKSSLMEWSDSRRGVVGDVYVYGNRYTGKREYFELKRSSYGYFPATGKSSADWTYLGNADEINAFKSNMGQFDFENKVKIWYRVSSFNSWGSNSNAGIPGSIYIYDNPHSGQRDYFKLKTTWYWYFPTDRTSNGHWEYLGSY